VQLTSPESTTLAASVALVIVMALAVRQDLATHRISNVLTFGALVAGLGYHTMAQGIEGFIFAIAGAGAGLCCLLPLYLGRGMGAGDVKMMAAAGSFLGLTNAVIAALLSLAIGAVIAIVVVAWRALEMRTAAAGVEGAIASATGFRAALLQAGKERIPYAAAIALGVVATMWWRDMFVPLVRSFT
jgi:prepilin peptidase CpaA